MLQPQLKTKLSLVALLIASSMLTACGDSTTNIVEKDPIAVDDDHDDDHDHADISTAGRLVISAKDSNLVSVYELEDGSLLDTFAVADTPSALAASPAKRYALVVQRTTDRVEFIDGGLFQEDHVDHLHDYQQAPELANFVLSDSRPTHITATDSQLAVFFDGDAASSTPAAVAVITEADITTDSNGYPVLNYSIQGLNNLELLSDKGQVIGESITLTAPLASTVFPRNVWPSSMPSLRACDSRQTRHTAACRSNVRHRNSWPPGYVRWKARTHVCGKTL